MPLYSFKCECGVNGVEEVMAVDVPNPKCRKCERTLTKEVTAPALIHMKGQGYPSRRKWMDNWTPDSPTFRTGSQHGEKY